MAQALIDMRNSPCTILHLTHPHPVSWSSIITPISHRLGLPLVPFSKWMQRLQASAGTTKTEMQQDNPALNLLEFYEHGEKATAEKEAMGLRTLDMSRAAEVAPALAKMKKSAFAAPSLPLKACLKWATSPRYFKLMMTSSIRRWST